ncbi:MAG: hypothetical protein ABL921_06610 [Pirellula sp.]
MSTWWRNIAIVSIGVNSPERVASWQSDLEVTESVDEHMSQLASQLPIVPPSVIKVPSTPLLSRPRFAEDQSIDLALAEEELSDSLQAERSRALCPRNATGLVP